MPYSHSRSLYSVMGTHGARQHNMKFNNTNNNKIKINNIYRGSMQWWKRRSVLETETGFEMSFKERGQSWRD